MKRVLIGLALGVVIAVPAGYGAAKVVSNPMTVDLDGGGYRASNLNSYVDTSGDTLGGGMLQASQVQLFQIMPGGGGAKTNIVNGDTAPNAPCEYQPPSTIWLRNDGLGHGQLWLKTGSGDCDWTLVAGTP